jgi:hypothetical protein
MAVTFFLQEAKCLSGIDTIFIKDTTKNVCARPETVGAAC